jgi:uncharacterized protein (DUF2147 family)
MTRTLTVSVWMPWFMQDMRNLVLSLGNPSVGVRKAGVIAMLRFACPLLGALLAAAFASAQSPTPVGVWLHANQRIQVQIAPCGDRLCGRMVWFRWPNDAGGLPLVDLKNRDPALRTRPLLGLTVVRGFRRTGERTWADGRIYNPDDGVDYRALITMPNDGTLRVRAYVLVPLLGKTFVWTRVR